MILAGVRINDLQRANNRAESLRSEESRDAAAAYQRGYSDRVTGHDPDPPPLHIPIRGVQPDRTDYLKGYRAACYWLGSRS